MEESTVSAIVENSTIYDYDFVFDDYDQHIVVGVAFLVASVLGIFGNTLVIFSVFASIKLRTVTNAFVVNLSIADLVTSLLIPWNSVILFSKVEYPIADWGCALVAGMLFTCVGCSLYTLASIALNRLVLITRPISTSKILFSPYYTGLGIAATWVIPFLFNIVPPLAGIGQLGTSQKYRVCATKSAHPLKNSYDYIQALGCFPVPLITLIVCYTLIYFHLRRHAQQLMQHCELQMPSCGGDTITSSVDGGTLPQNNGNNNVRISRTISTRSSNKLDTANRRQSITGATLRRREDRITKNMFIIFIAFFICITPFACTLFFDESAPFVPYATALILLNACVNPILYGFKHPHFKQVFKCLLTCKWHNIQEQSPAFRRLRKCFDCRK